MPEKHNMSKSNPTLPTLVLEPRGAALSSELEAKRFSVTTTQNPDAALAACDSARPTLVLLDLDVRGAGDLIAKIRERLPFAAMVAAGRDDGAVAALRQGADEFVSKSALNRELRAGIERALERRRLGRLDRYDRKRQRMEALGRLAAGMGHDFNNVLAVIVGFAELALADLDADDPRAQPMREIIRTCTNARTLTRKLAIFGRRLVTQPRVVDLAQLAAGMESTVRQVLGTGIELEAQHRTAGALVRVDPSQLEQAVLNLVENARDAMRRGGKLTLSTEQVTVKQEGERDILPVGHWVLLRVADTGVGIDPHQLETVFEPFFTRKKGSGVGLGLATTYGVVKQSGGYLFCDSELGRGTTFELYLPQVEGAAADIYEGEEERSALPRGSETVLLVEPDDAVLKVVRQLLELLGYRVIEARSVEQAVATYKREHRLINMVLSDTQLGAETGLDLRERLHALNRALRVMFLSGDVEGEVARELAASSPYPIIEKPVRLAELAHKVRKTLDTRRRGRPPKARGLY